MMKCTYVWAQNKKKHNTKLLKANMNFTFVLAE